MSNLMTQATYARSKGVSREYINRLVKQGIIRLVQGKVNPQQADRAIADYADPSRDDYRRDSGPKASQDSDKNSMAYWRRAEMQIKTALKKLEHDEKSGKLVNAEDVRRELAKAFTDVKTRIRAIAPKSAQAIAHMKMDKKNERELIAAIMGVLQKEHDEALGELAKWKQ